MELHIPGLAELRAEVAALRDEIRNAKIVPAPEWLRVPDAARQLGVSPDTIRRRIERGELEARGSGKLREVRLP